MTAEVTPHHLLMTDEWVSGAGVGRPPFNTNCRVNPPLRTDADRAALLEGLLDGTIDCIATDHAPHSSIDKDCEFDQAAPGISGLETAFGLLMRLVEIGQLEFGDADPAADHRAGPGLRPRRTARSGLGHPPTSS